MIRFKNLLFCFMAVFTYSAINAQAPVNPKASQKAKDLLTYIYSLKVNGKMLSGQHDYPGRRTVKYNEVNTVVGKYPAIWGSDMGFADTNNDKDGWYHRQAVIDEAKKKYAAGAVITLMWHACPPTDVEPCSWKPGVQGVTLTSSQWTDLLKAGTSLNNAWRSQVDDVAGYLKQLRDANIPVLWRPYHEMNGGWFWWGNRPGTGGYQALYKMLYDRMVNHHGLNNLIWVWNANRVLNSNMTYSNYYPGNGYVDILAADFYGGTFPQSDHDQLKLLGSGKPISMGEVGDMPPPSTFNTQPLWTWFMTWPDHLRSNNTDQEIKNLYNLARVYTRDEVVIPSGVTSTRYETENATRSGVVIKTAYSGYSGTGYGDYQNASNDYIEWTVNAPSAGTYNVVVRYSNGGTDRPLKVTVNGTVTNSSRSFPNTGGWGTWGTVTLTPPLVSGSNKIRLTAIGSSGPDIDYIERAASPNTTANTSLTQSLTLEPEEKASTLKIFPNPADDMVTIEAAMDLSNSKVTLTDMSGRKRACPYQANGNTITVQTAMVEGGNYILTVQTGNNIITKQLVLKP